jgi:hypothetical protein
MRDRSTTPACAEATDAKASQCGPGDVFTTLELNVRERPRQLADVGGAR